MKAQARAAYTASSPLTARLARDEFVKRYEHELPTATKCFLDDFEACFSHLRSNRASARDPYHEPARAFVRRASTNESDPHAFGERPVLKVMYSALIRASQTWQRVAISELELRQLDELRRGLDNDLSQRTASVVHNASRQRISSKETT